MENHYYLYIDDSGCRFPDTLKDETDYFALGGILVREVDKDIIEQKYKNFCGEWNITYPLHSVEIRGKRHNFSWLEQSTKKHENFMRALDNFLVSIPVIGFAAVVSRSGYNKRYEKIYGEKRWWMCKTSYSILIERVTKYVASQHGTFEIRFEQVGKKEDREIIKYSKELKTIGAPFNLESSRKYQPFIAFNYKKIIKGDPQRRGKENLFLQIADLYLYPMIKRKYIENYRPWETLYKTTKSLILF